ncbi:MAG: hypothetical protein VR73_01110 [Gammaproteobacteria bacterium BRH_c0]|nr:MAG: hypothetical protein VR73_01110 [Gammaproteobacteria bacterium BRH_c0]
MTNPRKLTLPWHLLVLDILGALLVARGIFLYIGDRGGVMYLVAGFLLMAPFGIHIVNQAVGKSATKASADTVSKKE